MEITPYAKNAKKHPQKQIDQLAAIIREVGWRQPIVVTQSGVIVVGHGRWATHKAYPDLGEPWVVDDTGRLIMGGPATTPLTSEQEAAYRLADNKLNESDWDMELVIDELKSLSDEMLDLTGFDRDLIIEPDEKDDEVPEVPEEPQSKLGDLYQLGNHRVLCGDSTKLEDVERLLNGIVPDLVYTDPPYGINEKGDRSKRGGITQGNKLKDFIDDSTQYAIDAYNLCESMGIKRQVWWGANYYCHSLPESNNWFVWDKRVEEKQSDTQSDCELAWVKSQWSSVRIFRHLWKGLMKASEHGQRRVHPTQKPVELARWAFDYFNEVKTVLDLFLGSGSTLIASQKTGRICYGMELDPRYISVILDRWSDYTGKDPILKETADPNDPRKGLAWSAIKNLNPLESS